MQEIHRICGNLSTTNARNPSHVFLVHNHFHVLNYNFVRQSIIVLLTHETSCLSWVYDIRIRFQLNIFIKQVWYFVEYASNFRFPSSLFFMVLQQCIFMHIFIHVCCAYNVVDISCYMQIMTTLRSSLSHIFGM